MGGLASALGNGFSHLFKGWGKGIGKAVDNYLLDAEGRKAISDEVVSKFKPKIDLARGYESKRAANIKELNTKLNESKALQDAKDQWQKDYDSALAGAKAQRQTDINDYKTKLKGYQDVATDAKTNKQSIQNKISDLENLNDPYRTIYTDVKSGDRYILHPLTNSYVNITKLYPTLNNKEARDLSNRIQNYETRLWDKKSDKVINVFDESNKNIYGKYSEFDKYLSIKEGQNAALLRDLSNADKQFKQANSDLNAWKKQGQPATWDDNVDLKPFRDNYKKTNSVPNKYDFNGQTYSKESDLDQAYQDALAHEQSRQGIASRTASGYASKRDAEIAQRIQDAKDIKKAKLALGAGAGIGALYAGARAIYGGDDTDNGNNTDNIDNTDNTYTGEPDADFNVEKEGQAILKDRQQAIDGMQQMDTGFDPDKAEAEAVLAGAAYDKGIEDGSSVKASDIVAADGNSIDDGLFELLKAMKDPYKADAIANYIYSRHGNDPEVQSRGWRAWLNRYGDSLRSKMGIDPSGYKGMHVSGGL